MNGDSANSELNVCLEQHNGPAYIVDLHLALLTYSILALFVKNEKNSITQYQTFTYLKHEIDELRDFPLIVIL